MIEGHGDDIYRYEGKVRYNFSSNICNLPFDGRLMRHLSGHPELLTSYPEPFPGSVEAAIADMEGIDAGNVIVTNGATEAIYLIAHAFSHGISAIVSPTFSEYEDACRIYGHEIIHIASLEDIPDEATAVWLCNPCNPTGKLYPIEEVTAAVTSRRDRLFVIDAAYAGYTPLPVIGARDAVDAGNVLLLGSFTKRYSVPGLRIGYAVGDTRLISRLRDFRMPWSVNALAIEAAHFLLLAKDTGAYTIDASGLHDEALRVKDALLDLGITVSDTDCNFMLCRLPFGNAAGLKTWLIDNYGILIRDASNFHGLSDRHFRIAVQSRDADDLLIDAIRLWMSL